MTGFATLEILPNLSVIMTALSRRLSSPLALLGLLLAVYATAFVVVQVLEGSDHPDWVAFGLTVDLVVGVPALVFFLFIRRNAWPVVLLLPVLLLSFGGAYLLIPSEYTGLLDFLALLIPVLEIALVLFIGMKAIRIVRANRKAKVSGVDFYDSVRETMRGAFDVPAVVNALAYEVSVFHYALSVRRPTPVGGAATYHLKSGYGAILSAIMLAATVELVGVHFLLRTWSELAAAIHILLSLYGVVWLVGDYRAMSRRPHVFGSTALIVRNGLRWQAEIPYENIRSVRFVRTIPQSDSYLNLVPFGQPKVILDLTSEIEALGPYGLTKQVDTIGMLVDDPTAFQERLRQAEVEGIV